MMRTLIFGASILIIFLAGTLLGSTYASAEALTLQERNKASPSDWVRPEQIKVYQDRVELDIQNVIWAEFTDTKSMDPVFDSTSHALEIEPKTPNDIGQGDIISYNTPESELPIIHRVTEIGNDGAWYAKVKGDNNEEEDPGKIRFNQINRVVIAIIY